MFNEDFSRRLSQLRTGKGVSARDMSLSIGQNAGYINSIENGKSLPSMTVFLSICERLVVRHFERRCQSFADGGNSDENGVFHHLAQGVGE